MTSEQQPAPDQSQVVAGQTDDGRVFVVSPNSMAVEGPPKPKVESDAGRGRAR